MATSKQTFGKPKPKGADGSFEFQLPDSIGSGRGRIPKGKYIGRCVDVVPDTSQSSGNPMWTWNFVITKGPQAGRDFKLWTVLTDDAAWKIVETLKGLGQEVEAGDKIKLNKKEVIGVGVTMHVKDDAGKDGDGEYSKLDKISAHPNGAGYKPGKLVKEEEEEDEGEEAAGDDDGEEEEGGDEGEEEEGTGGEEEEEEPVRRRGSNRGVVAKAPAKRSVAKKSAPARRR